MKEKKEKNREEKNSRTFLKFLKDERLHVITGLVLLFFSAYLLFAFISYLFTWKTDQSKLDITGLRFLTDSSITVQNVAGKAGALFANLFIFNWFGIASFSFLFILVIVGLRLMKIRLLSLSKTLLITLLLSVWLSVATGFFMGQDYFIISGAHGYFISHWINSLIGKIGTFSLLFISLFAFIIFSFNQSLNFLKNLFRKKTQHIDSGNVEIEITPQTLENEVNPEDIFMSDEGKDIPDIQPENKGIVFDLTPDQNKVSGDTTEQNDEITLQAEKMEEETTKDIITGPQGDYDPTLDLSNYKFPTIDLLDEHIAGDSVVTEQELLSNKNRIVETLGNYNIKIDKIKATIGPTVTLYEIVPAPGVRISKIKNLEDDIALSLSALGIRIIAPMPGKGTIGIEVPNLKPEIVSMRSIISSSKFQDSKYDLPIGLGKTISNETFVVDLTKMPHLLIAGATGQGKSVGVNAILACLLYKKHPSQIKFVLIDPKKVELTLYSKLEKHFLAKLPDNEEAIITDNKIVVKTLHSLTIEMENRYELLKKAQVRNIKEYNVKFVKRNLNPENGHQFMPYIVVIVDEFADLIMTAGKEVETPITRLAQLARAIGIHLIIATQRPSTNIITGVIKANFPVRIAFKVASMIDSRTILDSPGANQLIGRGDMLISMGSEMIRLQCPFVDTPEIEKITDFISTQQAYPVAFQLPEYVDDNLTEGKDVDLNQRDPMFDEAARLVVTHQQGSTSLIQRKFSIGYNRAGRLIDQLEAAGIVGSFEGSKARQVLFQDQYALEQFLSSLSKNVTNQ